MITLKAHAFRIRLEGVYGTGIKSKPLYNGKVLAPIK
jgi:hypothetical protein